MDRPLLARRPSIILAVVSTAMAAMAAGLLAPVFAFQLDGRGYDSATVGVFAATGSLAVMVGAGLVPRALTRLGTVCTLYAAFVVIAGSTLLYAATESIVAWFTLRLLLGLGAGVQWVVAETWLNHLALPGQRGRTMAGYIMTATASFAAGPALAGFVGVSGALPFVLATALASTAAILLLAGRNLIPKLPVEHRTGAFAGFRANALFMVVALVGGMNDMSVIALSPLYGLRVGYGEHVSALLFAAYMAGAVALQLPFGWLADRANRTAILVSCLGGCVVAGLLLPALHGMVLVWPLLFLWGGLSFGLYTVALTELAARVPAVALAGANAAFVVAYQSGSVSGPIVSGAAMNWFGPQGLPMTLLFIDAACLLVVLAVGFRRRA